MTRKEEVYDTVSSLVTWLEFSGVSRGYCCCCTVFQAVKALVKVVVEAGLRD